MVRDAWSVFSSCIWFKSLELTYCWEKFGLDPKTRSISTGSQLALQPHTASSATRFANRSLVDGMTGPGG